MTVRACAPAFKPGVPVRAAAISCQHWVAPCRGTSPARSVIRTDTHARTHTGQTHQTPLALPPPSPASLQWGVAFRLAGTREQQAAALSGLEWREKQYDVRRRVDVWAAGAHAQGARGAGGSERQPAVSGALVYIGSDDRSRNANYLGPASEDVIAATIATGGCRAPSSAGPPPPHTQRSPLCLGQAGRSLCWPSLLLRPACRPSMRLIRAWCVAPCHQQPSPLPQPSDRAAQTTSTCSSWRQP